MLIADCDHVGNLPYLNSSENNFNGKIFGSYKTIEIAKKLIEDSVNIHEKTVMKLKSQGKKVRPLFNKQQMNEMFSNMESLPMNKKIELDGCIVANSKEEALLIAGSYNIPIFIIGGGSIYKQFLNEANKIFLTLIDGEYEADTFFPNFYNDFKEINRESHIEQGYIFIDYERK